MIKIRQFSLIEQEDIINFYKNGEYISSLSKKYNCRFEAIKNVLIENKVQIRRKGTFVNKRLKEDFFEEIDTEEKAYFLGMMFTDGSVVLDKQRSPQISLFLKSSDIGVIERFKKELHLDSNLRYDKRENKESVGVSFRSKKMANDLEKYNIIPNKTYLTEHLPKIPDSFLVPFIRGLLDGDGSIYQETKSKKYRIEFYSYHQSVCEEFRVLCNRFLTIKNTNKIMARKSSHSVRFNTQDQVKQLATVLYKDSKVSLARKYRLAQILFEEK